MFTKATGYINEGFPYVLFKTIKVCMQKGSSKQYKAKGIPYVKLHGAGNDILVVFSRDMPKGRKSEFVKRIAHRQLGLGCDQLVEVTSLKPLKIQIWNADGSRAEMCANGTRVFLFLGALKGWFDRTKKEVPLQVGDAHYTALKVPGGYELCLGDPEIGSMELLNVGKERIPFWPVRTGNPHAVILATQHKLAWKLPRSFNFKEWGPQIEHHRRFPKRTNVHFLREMKASGKRATAKVEVWERGAGATMSCGSGAVASAAVVRGLTGAREVEILMTRFKLRVRFEGVKAFLSGPSALVSEGFFF
jgi:diaminopimelate epimerase